MYRKQWPMPGHRDHGGPYRQRCPTGRQGRAGAEGSNRRAVAVQHGMHTSKGTQSCRSLTGVNEDCPTRDTRHPREGFLPESQARSVLLDNPQPGLRPNPHLIPCLDSNLLTFVAILAIGPRPFSEPHLVTPLPSVPAPTPVVAQKAPVPGHFDLPDAGYGHQVLGRGIRQQPERH
mmetsp:Transcript_55043/g.98042  ORF Transcript_55043/g.98042 Transcript_55043/m.98042 type:complete len:176 (+) Transcript_55043:421-948(+)